MKSLKESLLGDMESNMQAGDDYVKKVENDLKEISDEITKLKNYVKYEPAGRSYHPVYKNGHHTGGLFKNTEVFKYCGYDANFLDLLVYQDENNFNDWRFSITLSKKDSDRWIEPEGEKYDYFIYLNISDFPTFKDILKKIIKPMCKDILVFNKALENIKKYNNRLISRENDVLK